MTRPLPPWPADGTTLHLRVPASAAGSAAACDAAERHLAAAGLTPRAAYRVQLVLEELVMNVALHAAAAEAAIAVARVPDGVLLGVEDDGPPFDPTQAAPAAAPSLQPAPAGGLGLVLVRKSALAWAYERAGGRHNRLTVLVAAA